MPFKDSLKTPLISPMETCTKKLDRKRMMKNAESNCCIWSSPSDMAPLYAIEIAKLWIKQNCRNAAVPQGHKMNNIKQRDDKQIKNVSVMTSGEEVVQCQQIKDTDVMTSGEKVTQCQQVKDIGMVTSGKRVTWCQQINDVAVMTSKEEVIQSQRVKDIGVMTSGEKVRQYQQIKDIGVVTSGKRVTWCQQINDIGVMTSREKVTHSQQIKDIGVMTSGVKFTRCQQIKDIGVMTSGEKVTACQQIKDIGVMTSREKVTQSQQIRDIGVMTSGEKFTQCLQKSFSDEYESHRIMAVDGSGGYGTLPLVAQVPKCSKTDHTLKLRNMTHVFQNCSGSNKQYTANENVNHLVPVPCQLEGRERQTVKQTEIYSTTTCGNSKIMEGSVMKNSCATKCANFSASEPTILKNTINKHCFHENNSSDKKYSAASEKTLFQNRRSCEKWCVNSHSVMCNVMHRLPLEGSGKSSYSKLLISEGGKPHETFDSKKLHVPDLLCEMNTQDTTRMSGNCDISLRKTASRKHCDSRGEVKDHYKITCCRVHQTKKNNGLQGIHTIGMKMNDSNCYPLTNLDPPVINSEVHFHNGPQSIHTTSMKINESSCYPQTNLDPPVNINPEIHCNNGLQGIHTIGMTINESNCYPHTKLDPTVNINPEMQYNKGSEITERDDRMNILETKGNPLEFPAMDHQFTYNIKAPNISPWLQEPSHIIGNNGYDTKIRAKSYETAITKQKLKGEYLKNEFQGETNICGQRGVKEIKQKNNSLQFKKRTQKSDEGISMNGIRLTFTDTQTEDENSKKFTKGRSIWSFFQNLLKPLDSGKKREKQPVYNKSSTFLTVCFKKHKTRKLKRETHGLHQKQCVTSTLGDDRRTTLAEKGQTCNYSSETYSSTEKTPTSSSQENIDNNSKKHSLAHPALQDVGQAFTGNMELPKSLHNRDKMKHLIIDNKHLKLEQRTNSHKKRSSQPNYYTSSKVHDSTRSKENKCCDQHQQEAVNLQKDGNHGEDMLKKSVTIPVLFKDETPPLKTDECNKNVVVMVAEVHSSSVMVNPDIMEELRQQRQDINSLKKLLGNKENKVHNTSYLKNIRKSKPHHMNGITSEFGMPIVPDYNKHIINFQTGSDTQNVFGVKEQELSDHVLKQKCENLSLQDYFAFNSIRFKNRCQAQDLTNNHHTDICYDCADQYTWRNSTRDGHRRAEKKHLHYVIRHCRNCKTNLWNKILSFFR